MQTPDNWNLGDVTLSADVANLASQHGNGEIRALLERHLSGDYGLFGQNDIDLAVMQSCRQAEAPFRSLYDFHGERVLIETAAKRRRTLVRLPNEGTE